MNVRIFIALVAGLLAGVALTAAVAQTSPLDPPRAAPHMFTTEFENDRVRVLRGRERNGETSPLHTLRELPPEEARALSIASSCTSIPAHGP